MSNLDKNFEVQELKSKNLKFYDPLMTKEMKLVNFLWANEDYKYQRFPQKSKDLVMSLNPKLWLLQANTAGGQLRFKTDSSTVVIHAALEHTNAMSIMDLSSQMGFDIYVGDNAKDLKYYNTTRNKADEHEYQYPMFENYSKKMRYILINFPLYSDVKFLEIGLDPTAKIEPADDFTNEGKIVVYGTSITQGGCCSRPGLNITNYISRKLDMEVLNYGFSGNGFGEPEVIDLISDFDDMRAFIIDYEANAGTNGKMELTLEKDISLIRKKHPELPIIVVSRIPYIFEDLNPVLNARRTKLREFQRDLVKKFNDNGDQNVHFVDGSKFLDTDYYDCTVDTIHPNDVGFERICKHYLKFIKEILNINEI
jgi:hypothetical protein